MTAKFAFVFPGQGSQSVGMLKEIAAEEPILRASFEEASDILKYDLWSLAEAGPLEKLNQTEFTQPALLTASVALWRLWAFKGKPLPDYLAGHSLGEYSALVCAGALSLAEGVSLVSLRGRLMQEAVQEGEGAMAALLGLSDEKVNALCEQASTDAHLVQAANYNAIGQVVISGHKEAVLKAIELAKAEGAKTILLKVSVPSHCELMRKASESLAIALDATALKRPSISILHNVNARPHTSVEAIKAALVDQLFKPVRWVETIQWMASQGVNTLWECGPGAVLCGLSKRIDPNLQCQTLSNKEVLCQ